MLCIGTQRVADVERDCALSPLAVCCISVMGAEKQASLFQHAAQKHSQLPMEEESDLFP